MRIPKIQKLIQSKKNSNKAKILMRFFKTGKGEYGEGDIFLGITVPISRSIARQYTHLAEEELEKLLTSKFHEERLIALLILVEQFQKGTEKERSTITHFYLSHTKYINNWDLVDLSADKILGSHLLKKSRSVLYRLARSSNIWERRIAIISTFAFIKNGEYEDTFQISKLLMYDKHDLIHKATGWMLREIAKRIDTSLVERFLMEHIQILPRTALRYAIERFPKERRNYFLTLKR